MNYSTGIANFHSQKPSVSDPASPHPCPHLLITGFYSVAGMGVCPYLSRALATPPVADKMSISPCVFLPSVYLRGYGGNVSVHPLAHVLDCWLFWLLVLDILNSSLQALLSGLWFASFSRVYSLSFYPHDRVFPRVKVGLMLLSFVFIHCFTVAQLALNLWEESAFEVG